MPEQPPPLVSSGKIGNDNAGSPPKKAMIWVGAWFIAFLAPKEKKVYIVFLVFLEFLGLLKPTPINHFAFVLQNNRFCNVLIMRWLYDRYSCKKYLHFLSILFVQKVKNIGKIK